jgi:xylulose-5-phosphate/fructose-6-phosphate phosphoketolase
MLLRDLRMPDFHAHAVTVPSPGAVDAQDTLVLGRFLRDVTKLNQEERNFRVFGPDETLSNLLGALFEVTDRQWEAPIVENDEFLAPDGRVLDSMLSEHQCEGWLEGYLLTGRHGLFNCYEAFIHIVDSMFNQHAKWLKVTSELPWRRKISSLNYLLSSHVWQQDHNGFTHQDPGFLDHVVNKKADIVRVYLPPDANCLLSVVDHCLRSRDYINVVVAGKHALPQWLSMDEAVVHCTEGIGIWDWASNDQGSEPDVVMACCGDTPTLEVLAATSILRQHLPELKVRVVNVVDLMKLQPASEHPHGLSDTDYDSHLHQGQAHHLRLPRLPLAGPPPGLPAHQPQPACPGLQGRGHDHHAVRHEGAKRPRPLPPGPRCARPAPGPGLEGQLPKADGPGQARPAQGLHRPVRPGHAGSPGLEVGELT